MGKPLSLMWCRSCVAAHVPGEHLKRPLTTAPVAVAPRPVKAPQPVTVMSRLHTTDVPGKMEIPKGTYKHLAMPIDQPAAKPKPKKKRKSRPPKDGKFSKDYFQMCYMATRREADAAGFGGGKDPHHPKYNPNYKTVNEYNAWKLTQKDTK